MKKLVKLIIVVVIINMFLLVFVGLFSTMYLNNNKDFFPNKEIKNCYNDCFDKKYFTFLERVYCEERFIEMNEYMCYSVNKTKVRNYCLGNCFINTSFYKNDFELLSFKND
jgi:hypothetical protein